MQALAQQSGHYHWFLKNTVQKYACGCCGKGDNQKIDWLISLLL